MVLDEESRKPSHTEDMIQFVCVHVYVCFTHKCYKHQKKQKELHQSDNAYLRR